MTQAIIDIGDAPNDGTGDPVRSAFTKCNANFTELYTADSAFTASSTAPSSANPGAHWYDLSTGVLSIYINDGTSSQWVMVSPSGGGTATPGPPQGRLTLQAATPVMTTTQSAKTTIFYSPYTGDQIPLYSGSAMVMTTFTELSVATTDTTKNPAAIGASKVNDWFVWSDAGTVRIGHGPDWTSDTARSAGTALVMQNGILLNNAAITNGPAAQRGTYVGTTRSNASSQLDWIFGSLAAGGGKASFYVWNAYNRVAIGTLVSDSTDSEAYNITTWHPLLNSANNAVDFVSGLAEDAVAVDVQCYVSGDGNAAGGVTVGLDTTTAPSGPIGAAAAPGSNISAMFSATLLGKHTVTALGAGSGTSFTFFGDQGLPSRFQEGLRFQFRM